MNANEDEATYPFVDRLHSSSARYRRISPASKLLRHLRQTVSKCVSADGHQQSIQGSTGIQLNLYHEPSQINQ